MQVTTSLRAEAVVPTRTISLQGRNLRRFFYVLVRHRSFPITISPCLRHGSGIEQLAQAPRLVVTMLDAEDCRKRATKCVSMAEHSSDRRAQESWRKLSESWVTWSDILGRLNDRTRLLSIFSP